MSKPTFTRRDIDALAETIGELTDVLPRGGPRADVFWARFEGCRGTLWEDLAELALATERQVQLSDPFQQETHDYTLFTEALAHLYVTGFLEDRVRGLTDHEADDLVIRALNVPGVAYSQPNHTGATCGCGAPACPGCGACSVEDCVVGGHPCAQTERCHPRGE